MTKIQNFGVPQDDNRGQDTPKADRAAAEKRSTTESLQNGLNGKKKDLKDVQQNLVNNARELEIIKKHNQIARTKEKSLDAEKRKEIEAEYKRIIHELKEEQKAKKRQIIEEKMKAGFGFDNEANDTRAKEKSLDAEKMKEIEAEYERIVQELKEEQKAKKRQEIEEKMKAGFGFAEDAKVEDNEEL